MTTITVGKTGQPIDTKVSSFDKLNGALIASILLVGFLVSVLFVLWLTALDFKQKKAVELIELKEPFGNEKPEGYEDDVLEPGVEEFPEVETPQLKDALEAVTDAVSSVKANLEKRDGDAAEMGKGRGFGSRDGGPGSGNANVVPEYKRWRIEYESEDISVYAQQLDHFSITIGAVATETSEIVLVNNMSGGINARTSSRKEQSKVLRFEHKKMRMRRWDQTFCQQAGVDLRGRVTVQFYPDITRQKLRTAEARHLQSLGKTLEEVRRTYFKVVPAGGGFEYQVTDMLFLN